MITKIEASEFTKEWYQYIMEQFYKENNRFDSSDISNYGKYLNIFQKHNTLNHINTLEGCFQSSNKNYSYFAWTPREKTTKKSLDVLAILACNMEIGEEEKRLSLRCVMPNPCWSSENIDIKELKKCILSLQNDEQVVDIEEFLADPNNIRFKLDWSI